MGNLWILPEVDMSFGGRRLEIEGIPLAHAEAPGLTSAQLQHELRLMMAAVVSAFARLGLARRRIGGDFDDAMARIHPQHIERNPHLIHPIWVEPRLVVDEEHSAAAR